MYLVYECIKVGLRPAWSLGPDNRDYHWGCFSGGMLTLTLTPLGLHVATHTYDMISTSTDTAAM